MSVSVVHFLEFFYFFSKTVGRILVKLGGDVPWVDVYQVCSVGGAGSIFSLCTKGFLHFVERIFKNLLLRNCQGKIFEIKQEASWGVLDLKLFSSWCCDFLQSGF